MWDLILKKDIGNVVIQSFKTKKEAQQEIENREGLLFCLRATETNDYCVRRNKKGGSFNRSLSKERG
tara:strand:+ start:610 stop:810 length:201 start_codon:yes stop_codon:yes gene_type:complete